jgi:hypothetical protein
VRTNSSDRSFQNHLITESRDKLTDLHRERSSLRSELERLGILLLSVQYGGQRVDNYELASGSTSVIR